MQNEVILSTKNPSKAEQIKAVFAGSEILILDLDQAEIQGQGIEDGNTLAENAFKKALFVHQQKPKVWAMADDTGIFIDALNGKPGVHTANWHGGNSDTEQMLSWILEQLKDVASYSATFKTVVVIISPEGNKHFFEGAVRGTLLKAPRTKPQPKMPYSSIFVPDGFDKTWSEMSVQEENVISHRGKASRQAREFLEQQLS